MTNKHSMHVHTTRLPLRWGDMDALGHVNNTAYFQFMEEARTGWIRAAFPRPPGAPPTPVVVVNASCTFLVPLEFPGEVEVRMAVGDPGRTSVGSHYEIWKDGVKHAEGAAKLVWLDEATGRPTPLPAPLVAALHAAAGAANPMGEASR